MTRYRVIASSLNVRAGPSTESEVVGWLQQDSIVERTRTSADGYWYRIRRGKTQGWCAHKYLVPIAVEPDDAGFPWLAIAKGEIGTRERPGKEENARIVEYLHSTNLGAPDNSRDETPWCSAFVNWCTERAGYEGTDSAWARSWLNWGKALKAPRPGCVVVLSRGNDAGHVGFYVGKTASGIQVLGGNQGDRVCISTFPLSRVLGYRAPGA